MELTDQLLMATDCVVIMPAMQGETEGARGGHRRAQEARRRVEGIDRQKRQSTTSLASSGPLISRAELIKSARLVSYI